jgi:hypothetical protein
VIGKEPGGGALNVTDTAGVFPPPPPPPPHAARKSPNKDAARPPVCLKEII